MRRFTPAGPKGLRIDQDGGTMDEATMGLARRSEQVLGEPYARVLMDGLTFTADDELARRSDLRALDGRMDGLEGRMGALEGRMGALEQELHAVEQRLVIQMHKEMVTQVRFFAVTMGAVVISMMGLIVAVV